MTRLSNFKTGLAVGAIGAAAYAGIYSNAQEQSNAPVVSIRPPSSVPLEERQQKLADMIAEAQEQEPISLADYTRDSLRFDGEASPVDGVFPKELKDLIDSGVLRRGGEILLNFELPVTVSIERVHTTEYVGHPEVTVITLGFDNPKDGKPHKLSIMTPDELDPEDSTRIKLEAAAGNLHIGFPTDIHPDRYNFKTWNPGNDAYGHFIGNELITTVHTLPIPSTLGLLPVDAYEGIDDGRGFFGRLEEMAVGDDVLSILTEAGAYVNEDGAMYLPIHGLHLKPQEASELSEPLIEIDEATVDANGRYSVGVQFNIVGRNGQSVRVLTTVPDYTPEELRHIFRYTSAVKLANGASPEEFEQMIVADGPSEGAVIYFDFNGATQVPTN